MLSRCSHGGNFSLGVIKGVANFTSDFLASNRFNKFMTVISLP
jgi:hypothetical protein